MTIGTRQKATTLAHVRNLDLLAFMPDIEELDIEQCAELAAVIRKQIQTNDDPEKEGAVVRYQKALMTKVDENLRDQNVRKLEVPGIVSYSFAEIAGRYIIDGAKLWPKLRHLRVSRERAFDFVPNKEKLATLVNDGVVPIELIESVTTQGAGYERHTMKLLNEF